MREITIIEAQLDRVLGFFPRIEARINGLFGVNTLILVVGALNISVSDLKLWYVTVPGTVAVPALAMSYVSLFRANFPDVRGGAGSLIFFAEIQKRTETTYLDEFLACSDDDFRKDIIGQIWRNSQIICEKYVNIKKAIISTTVSLIPLFIFLAATASLHLRIPILTK
ncbi:hypothetical protein NS277_07800 [Novosphingobium barchaimii]|nr:hypothetical protein NS277_07800 [Novosphingobium barchaimii]